MAPPVPAPPRPPELLPPVPEPPPEPDSPPLARRPGEEQACAPATRSRARETVIWRIRMPLFYRRSGAAPRFWQVTYTAVG